MHQHVQTSHCGAEQTKRLIRNNYWVVGSKRKIKSVLKQCKNRECRKWQLKPIAVPPPSLPKERMEFECFKSISLDGFGPIEMITCATCQYNALCAECGKRKRVKLTMAKRNQSRTHVLQRESLESYLSTWLHDL